MNHPTFAEFFHTIGIVNRYKKGQVIYSPHDSRDTTMLIASGLVKIYDIDSFGNERTVSIFGTNHLIPIVWPLRQSNEALYFYQALSPVETYSAPQQKVLAFVKTQPGLLLELIELLVKAYMNQDARIYNLQRANTREKLEFILYYLAVRLGTTIGTISVLPAVITRSEIANLIGASRESISRELNNITATGLMWKQDGKTYIDLSKINYKDFHTVNK